MNDSAFQIDKTIPIRGYKNGFRFPFEKMDVNDSFLIPETVYPIQSARTLVFNSIKLFNGNQKKKFKILTRKMDGGLRVWRIA